MRRSKGEKVRQARKGKYFIYLFLGLIRRCDVMCGGVVLFCLNYLFSAVCP